MFFLAGTQRARYRPKLRFDDGQTRGWNARLVAICRRICSHQKRSFAQNAANFRFRPIVGVDGSQRHRNVPR